MRTEPVEVKVDRSPGGLRVCVVRAFILRWGRERQRERQDDPVLFLLSVIDEAGKLAGWFAGLPSMNIDCCMKRV